MPAALSPAPAASRRAPGTPIIEVRDLEVRYGERTTLRGINLTVHAGEVLVILGGSGSGKSTLLKCLLGVLAPSRGSVHVLGTNLATAGEREREAAYKRMGVVYQSGALFSSMSVGDNVRLPMREHAPRLDRQTIDIMMRMKLGQVQLSDKEDSLPSELSGGQAKRAAFARAIALDPELLLCDEPSAGLDPRIGRGLDDLIRSLNKALRMTIVVVTHEMESVRLIADRVVLLHPEPSGAVVAYEGTLPGLFASDDPRVRDFVQRVPVMDPAREGHEVLRRLVGEAT